MPTMDDSIQLIEEEKSSLTLELVGVPAGGNETPRNVRVSIDQVDGHEKEENTKLVVSFPPLMDTAHASCSVDLMLDRWGSNNSGLHTLAITRLRFTEGGVACLANFFGMQNVEKTIKQIIFHDIIGGRVLREDDDHVYALCKTFQNAINLEIIDLSYNVIGGYVWEALGMQVKLKQLTLRDVEMDDASLQALQSSFASGSILQSFTFSNRTRTGQAGCKALNDILSSCHDLRSFVWEYACNKHKPLENLPVAGLAQLSKNMFKNDFGCMRHLELTGGIVPANPITLCSALEGFHKLQGLKLSHAGLDSEKIQRIVTALRSSRPPLGTIDFSYNQIDDEGASWIAQLSCLRAVTKNLRLLNLNHNRIGKKGALEIVEKFAPKSSDFRLQLEGNAFDPCGMFLSLASSKYSSEAELKDLRKDCERIKAEKMDAQSNLRELLQAQSAMINDMRDLKAKAKQLEEDKQGLVNAFGVLGMMQHVEERDNILTRLNQLEQAVLGHPQNNGIKNGKIEPTSGPGSSRPSLEPTCLSRKSPRAKAKSFDDATATPSSVRVNAPRSASLDENTPLVTPVSSNNDSVSSLNANNLGRTPRSTGRPATARNQLVKAASERWKSLLTTPKSPEHKKQAPLRSKSSKSLAEFLNRSAPAVFGNYDDSFTSLEDDSIQTMPAPLPSLGGTRRRIRQQARGLPPRNESKSLQSPTLPPLDDMIVDNNDSIASLTDHVRNFEV